MALDAKHRSSIYVKLLPLLGEEDANAMMSEFPSVEADELVTKQFLRAELGLTRGELRDEMASLRSELRDEMASLRSELRDEMALLGTELRGEIAGLRTEMEAGFHQQTLRLYTAIGVAVAILGTLTRLG